MLILAVLGLVAFVFDVGKGAKGDDKERAREDG